MLGVFHGLVHNTPAQQGGRRTMVRFNLKTAMLIRASRVSTR